jgi:hypothetical protein
MATTCGNGHYVVQYREDHTDAHGWVDCVREDLLEQFDGETAKLPQANFQTPDEAFAFITAMCGLMHCGGNLTDFRVVDKKRGYIIAPRTVSA